MMGKKDIKIKTRPVLLLLITSFIVLSAFVLDKGLRDKIANSLKTFNNRYPQEKVYLQFDKPYYSSGETIWFKAYVTSQGSPTYVSKNLYVELLNKTGKVLKRKLLPIDSLGGTHGDMELSQDFSPGDYRIRAYTAWMLNFDPGFLFRKDIQVFDPNSPPQAATRPDTAAMNYAVQFFPEGGDMVDGVNSMIAFKAINENGLPVDSVKGRIIDDQGNEITTFASVHDGMGTFKLQPVAGRTYRAVLIQSGGATKTFPLPAAKTSGLVLHVINTNNGKAFFQVLKNKQDTVHQAEVVGQIQDQLAYMATINFDSGAVGGMIPLEKMLPGIMQLTVFTEDGMPRAERLVFNNNEKFELHPNLTADTINFEARSPNAINLHIPDAQHANFSVAVTDADQVQYDPNVDNIISNLLLTSDIKGDVYNPGWYFDKDHPDRMKDLDLVMLTNGWSRFVWKNLLDHHYPSIRLMPEQGLQIKGQAFEKSGLSTLNNGKIDLILKEPADSSTTFITAPVNQLGQFNITGLNFHDTANIYYKGTDTLRKGKNIDVRFSNHFTDNMSYVKLNSRIQPTNEVAHNQQLLNFLNLSKDRNHINDMINRRPILLQEVNVRAARKTQAQTMDQKYASGMFAGGDAYNFDLTSDNNIGYTNIYQYLQARVPGLQISGNTYAPNGPGISYRGGTPGFYLNEMPVDEATLSTININDVAYIKVFRPPFMGSFGGANGAIAIYTKKGGDVRSDIPGFEKMEMAGYSITKEFYSPDYAVHKDVHELPDKRATLYWNPQLPFDSTTHTAHIHFYNNDLTKRYRVIVEGIDSQGKIGFAEKVFDGQN